MNAIRFFSAMTAALVLSACSKSESESPVRPTFQVVAAPSAGAPPAQAEVVRSKTESPTVQQAPSSATARYAPSPGMPQRAFDTLKIAAYAMCKSRSMGPDHPASAFTQKLAIAMAGNADKGSAWMRDQLSTIAADRMQCKASDAPCQQKAQEQANTVLADMQAKKQQGAASEEVLIEYLGENKERLCK